MKQECDIFLIRDDRGPILYAPLRDLTARINEAAVSSVARYLHNDDALPEDEAVLKTLEAHGFFDQAPLPHTDHTEKPVHVTLFPNDGCNLRCCYCYAQAEQGHTMLSPEAGKAAIEQIALNAAELGKEDFIVSFHGNGEPMRAFPLIRELCAFADELGKRHALQPKYLIATNGVLNTEKTDYLIRHFAGVHVSFDGLPEIQNAQRPLADGSDSFPSVDATLRALDASQVHYGIRVTLTAESVGRLEAIASYVVEHYPRCSSLHIEPVWECGRCLQTDAKTPDPQAFIRHFIAAQDICENEHVELSFSTLRTNTLTDAFCGVNNDSFTVTAEGLVTACYEVASREDPRADTYLYGYFDKGQHCFIFDDEKRKALHRMTVYNMPHCTNCFCRYHCAGDCVAKVLGCADPNNHHGSDRCEITRALTLDAIRRTLRTAEDLMRKEEDVWQRTIA